MTITVHVPDSLLEDLGETPEELRREILRVAAIHLYSRGLVSQGRGRRSPVWSAYAKAGQVRYCSPAKRDERDGSDIVKLGGPADVRAIFNRADAAKAGRVRYCAAKRDGRGKAGRVRYC